MPTVVVTVLLSLVGVYLLSAGTAALGFFLARRQDPPSVSSEWPSVRISSPDPAGAARLRDKLQSSDLPTDRIEVLPNLPERKPDARDAQEAPGEVVLTHPPGADVSPEWVRSMVRLSQTEAAVVVGPTIVEHDDLFLPRLEALQHLGRLGWIGGFAQAGLPIGPGTANRADHTAARSADPGTPTAYNPDPDAAVTRSPAASFGDLIRRQATWFRRAMQSSSRFVQAQTAGLWLIHAVLLACGAVAVAVPAWRQPTLLALLGKMGADVLLFLPAATHYGQRQLLRSLVPTVLMLVVLIPLAGGWALVGPSEEMRSEGGRTGMETR